MRTDCYQDASTRIAGFVVAEFYEFSSPTKWKICNATIMVIQQTGKTDDETTLVRWSFRLLCAYSKIIFKKSVAEIRARVGPQGPSEPS